MNTTSVPAHRAGETYFELDATGGGRALPVTDRFWNDLVEGVMTIDGRLAGVFDMTQSLPHWERHPLGEELICLITGAVDAILDETSGPRTVRLSQPGDICLVPRGVWHRFEVREAARILFVTYGEGTDHRPA